MFFEKIEKQMKEKMLERFKFSAQLKDELVQMVMYKGEDPKSLTIKYRLPHVSTLLNWVAIYKKKLNKGAVTLPAMEKPKKADPKALQQRIKQLEKSLEKANVMIYGLNAMIDYAEKELKVPVRKKPGTK
jgi:transposase-like protein